MFTGMVVVVDGRIESWKPRARSRARSRTKATTEFGPVPFPRGNGAGQRRWFFSGGRWRGRAGCLFPRCPRPLGGGCRASSPPPPGRGNGEPGLSGRTRQPAKKPVLLPRGGGDVFWLRGDGLEANHASAVTEGKTDR